MILENWIESILIQCRNSIMISREIRHKIQKNKHVDKIHLTVNQSEFLYHDHQCPAPANVSHYFFPTIRHPRNDHIRTSEQCWKKWNSGICLMSKIRFDPVHLSASLASSHRLSLLIRIWAASTSQQQRNAQIRPDLLMCSTARGK